MTVMTEPEKLAVLAALDAEMRKVEGRDPDDDNMDVETDEGDVIVGVRYYIDSTQPLDRKALAEVAYAFLAGVEHDSANTDKTRPAYAALRRAGLSL